MGFYFIIFYYYLLISRQCSLTGAKRLSVKARRDHLLYATQPPSSLLSNTRLYKLHTNIHTHTHRNSHTQSGRRQDAKASLNRREGHK